MGRLRFLVLAVLWSTVAACSGIAPAVEPQTQRTPPDPSTISPDPIQPVQLTGISAFDPSVALRPSVRTYMPHASEGWVDVRYCVLDGVELQLDLFFPRDMNGVTPLVVFIHGGGWFEGDKGDAQGQYEIPALLDVGFTVATLNYRLAPEYQFPAMVEDVKCAIRYLRAHALDYNFDPDRIVVMGFSAGAHLSNLIGLTGTEAGFDRGEYLDQSSRVSAVVDIYGPIDLTTDFSRTFKNLREDVFADFDLVKASPITYVSADDPPFLIVHGDMDRVVPLRQSEDFYKALAAAGVEASLVVVKNGNHGFSKPDIAPSREEITGMIVDYIVDQLR